MLVPVITLYLSKKANRKQVVPSVLLLFQYAVAASLNIPLTRIFTFILKKISGMNIEADSSYYTFFAIASAVLLFVVNQTIFSIKNKTKNSYYAKLVAIVLVVCLFAGAFVFVAPKLSGINNEQVKTQENEENSVAADAATFAASEVLIQDTEISWILNDDGTYTFTNNMGNEESLYAWYVIENEEPIEKTEYVKDPSFTYDLKGNDQLVIKGFVRNYKKNSEEYDQSSYKVNASTVLNKLEEYGVLDIRLPSNIDSLLDLAINKVMTDDTIPAEKVLKGDGSDWETDLVLPVDWSCPDISTRSYGFLVNGFFFLDDAWRKLKDGEVKYGPLIADYMLDWANQNQEYKEDTWQWHDDATANRVLRWACFFLDVNSYYSDDEKKIIEQSLSYQLELLSSDGFYTENHNHGMHQDIALIIGAMLSEAGDIQKAHIEKAINRAANYYDYVYAADGVHKEHSPFYARDTLISMQYLADLLIDISPDFVSHIDGYIQGAGEYLIQVIMPNGNWPSLGDSSETNGIRALSTAMENNDEFGYISSGKGIKPPNNAVFDKGGYAIFRSSWDDSPDVATWMLFNAATHSSVHKHGDDLELLIYHKGDFVTEAGKRNYNYSDEQTAWAYSGYAHNVLIVNDEAYPVKISENGYQSVYPDALKTKITEYDISDEQNPSVKGFECRFENVEQIRSVTFSKTDNLIIVDDICTGTEDYDGSFLWHIAPGIEIKENVNGWDCYRNDEILATISIETETEFSLETFSGQGGEYPFETWIFGGKEDPTYGSLLKVNFKGTDGTVNLKTVFDLK